MSFLSRRTSRPDQRGRRSGAGRQADSEHGDYDYAPEEYQQDDENWSPDEYFSPEGIKGRWAAGTRHAEQPAGYGRDAYQQRPYGEDDGYGDYGTGEYATGDYGTGEYATGGYETVDGPDGDRDQRVGGRKRRADRADRADRGERRRRLGRKNKDENEIWPDDGVSDEDYWASVASDKPLTAAGLAPDADPMNAVNSRPMARPAAAAPPARDSWQAPDMPVAAESRFAGEPRTGSGRLGPAPGMAPAPAAPRAPRTPGYVPGAQGTGSRPMMPDGAGAASGPMGRLGGPGSGPMPRAGSGPMPRAGSGPMPRAGMNPDSGPMARPGVNSGPMARPGGVSSGPMARAGGADSGPMARQGTGATPAWPANGSGGTGAYPARPAAGPAPTRSGTGPTPARGATGPVPARPASGPAPARHATAPNGARPAAGLAQPGMSQPNLSTPAQPTVAQPALAPSFQPNAGHGSGRRQAPPPERSAWGDRTERIDRVNAAGYPDPRKSGRGQASPAPAAAPAPASVWGQDGPAAGGPREQGRTRTAGTGGYPSRIAEDDPLTSRRYSREELSKTDGRSYRVASRRAQVTAEEYAAALTEQTQTFSLNGQQGAGPQPVTGRYPASGGQQPARQPRQPANPYDQGAAQASYPYSSQPYQSWPAADQDEDRHGRPAGYGENGRHSPGARSNGNGNGRHGNPNGNGGYSNGNYSNGNGGYANGNGGYANGYGGNGNGNGRH